MSQKAKIKMRISINYFNEKMRAPSREYGEYQKGAENGASNIVSPIEESDSIISLSSVL